MDGRLPPRTYRLVSYRWELVAWLWLAFLLNQADRQLFAVVMPQLKTDLGASDLALGVVASVFTAALALTVPFAGWLGDRFSRTRVVVSSLAAWSAATLLTGFGSSLAYLLLIRSIATGVGEACYAPSAHALISTAHVETRARAMSTYQTSVYVGVVASGLVGGWVADRLGWRAAFWIFGAAGIGLAAVLARRLQPEPASLSGPAMAFSPGPAVAALVERPTLVLFALASAGMIFVNVGYLAWTPTYLHERYGLSLAASGFASMFWHHAAAFAGVLVGGWTSDRLAPRRPRVRLEIQALGLLLGAPWLFAVGRAQSVEWTLAALAGFGFCRGLFDSNTYPTLYALVPPRQYATASGLLIAFAFLLGALAPALLGIVKEREGLAVGLSSLAFVYLAASMVAFAGARWRFEPDAARAQTA